MSAADAAARPGAPEPPRVGALLRMRLGSERLPNKGLVEIAGKPVVAHILERMFAARSLRRRSDVILCTTEDPGDDPLVSVVEAAGARVFRGSQDDVIARITGAVRAYPFDVVIQVDGDDVCVDPLYMDLCVDAVIGEASVDVAICEGQPVGIGAKALRTSAIERVASRYVPGPNGTGGMLYFTRSGLCKVVEVGPVGSEHQHDTARLTLDYPEDLEFFRALFAELYRPGEVFGTGEIVSLLQRRPELVAINAHLADRYDERSAALIEQEVLRYRDDEGVLRTLEARV